MRLIAKRDLPCAVYGVTTVQEEIGLRGATTSTYGCEPHAGIAVDVDHATDYPFVDARGSQQKINAGPVISRGPNINPSSIGNPGRAKRHKIPYQVSAAPRATGTDANAMQLSRQGVATGLIGIPNRYMHSPVELLSLTDAEHAAQLIAEWVCSLSPKTSFIP